VPNPSTTETDKKINPIATVGVGSFLEAESYFKSPDYADSYYFPYNPDPLCRGNNYKIYDEMRDDDQVKVALAFKKDLVVNSGWEIECPSPAVKAFVEDSLKRMEQDGSMGMSFDDVLRDMLSSYEYGFSMAEPVFRIVGGLYQYDSIRVRPPQTFRFCVDDKGDVDEVEQNTNHGTKSFSTDFFIHHVYQQEWGNPYGKSDLRAIHNPWKSKKFVTKFLAIYLERFAGPTVVGRYPDTWGEDEVAKLRNVLKSIQQATTLTLPEGALVEFVQANKESSDIYIRALNFYNMHMARGLLVPDLLGIGGEKTGGGSYSLGQDQFSLFLSSLEKDRKSLGNKLTIRLIAPLVAANFGPGIPCTFKFLPYSKEDQMELMKLWIDAAKGKLFKPNPEEVNHLRRQTKFPEGIVVEAAPEPAPGMFADAPGLPPEGEAGFRQFASKRAFTAAEKKVDFAVIQKSLDTADEELNRRLKRAAKTIWSDYLDQIVSSGLIGRFDPKRLNDLKPRKLKDFNATLKNAYGDLMERAFEEAKREIFPDRKFSLSEGELGFDDMMEVLEAEAFNTTADYAGLASKRVNTAIVKGLKQSMPTADIIRAVKKEMEDATDAWVNTLVRTKTTEVYNRGRKSYFDNDREAKEIIKGYQFSAILDGRTTEVCSRLDGKVFESDDSNINLLTPPLHFNCRSVIVPVTRFESDTLSDSEEVPSREKLRDMGAGLL
jgi:SPP1 gp7 family putative phage head morphogenesis protein